MRVLVALTVGLVIWVVGWALGAKPFDTFMIAAFLVVSAAAARIAEPYIRERIRP